MRRGADAGTVGPTQKHEEPAGSTSIRVRCDELAPSIGDLSANVGMIARSIADAATDGVQLLVLPELATSGYYLRDIDEARRCAIPANGSTLRDLAALLPPGMTVVVGFCEDLDGVLYNSAAVLTELGVISLYRKTHLWDDEKKIFTAGDSEPPVIDTPAGRLGMLICYDLEFPEMPRSLAVRGAQIIAVPTNWPLVSRPEGEHPPEVLQAMASARSSRVAIACCDRSGNERGNRWTEGTSIIGPDGWLTGAKRSNGRIDAEIGLSDDHTRIGPVNDALHDRRPHVYSKLLTSEPGS